MIKRNTIFIALVICTVVFTGCFTTFAYFEGTKSVAEKGDPDAQYYIGCVYYDGIGEEQNYTEAFAWFSKSAKQGNVHAQLMLGKMYHDGQGITKDYTEAFNWLKKAAEQDSALAQYAVGLMYANGEGIKQDTTEAKIWLSKAAEQGNQDAQKALKELEHYHFMQQLNVIIPWLISKKGGEILFIILVVLAKIFHYILKKRKKVEQ